MTGEIDVKSSRAELAFRLVRLIVVPSSWTRDCVLRRGQIGAVVTYLAGERARCFGGRQKGLCHRADHPGGTPAEHAMIRIVGAISA